ncbi:bifunctional 3'-5' exonuclease/DNA polymerase [Auraticoccus sp. F435]|uniref:DNA-directed DNA polymerase n=1 Tax=Auraticoccus cholistanensis TaxID=2656650 RepID=A0A6A9UTQ4_9ACTN|nr:bifunctional 3'-5' exonuclease/DNA polymerase [Auraticoccus cholistanensis]
MALAWQDGELLLAVPAGPADDARPVAPERYPDLGAARDRLLELERAGPRWVWGDTRQVAPHLLAAGVRLRRCTDLRLSRDVLRRSSRCRWPSGPADDEVWDGLQAPPDEGVPSLLDLPQLVTGPTLAQVLAEHARQQRVLATAEHAGRLRLLLAAESAGALVAAELKHDGMPWSRQVHDAQLRSLLGEPAAFGGRPSRLEELCAEIRGLLRAPRLNPDSQPELLQALRTAGLGVQSTRQWELEQLQHPVVAPLLEYKKLSRLATAHGWHWLETWVRDARFHPDYVVAGVVTGRWATNGGGALQLPRQIRSAVVADPGHRLVVADAAQLEPRILAAMSGDEQMARAGSGADLYAGLVADGVVATRPQAKVAMLGALYGATSGEAGQLMPRLLRTYPLATGLVEEAARTGERGGQVTTWLGRTSPPPSSAAAWTALGGEVSGADLPESERRDARRSSRDWGRFTRNFVVQGSAAEWALCWLAGLRTLLAGLADGQGRAPRLAYFLHDEVMVHTPEELAEQVVAAVHRAAAQATALMFGGTPVEFPLSVAVVQDYGQAK